MTEVAKEQHGLPEGWVWCSVDAHEQPEDFIKLRGAVYEPMKSGKRKGEPNWKKPKPGTERTVFVRQSDVKAWEARQEKETGECMKCDGTGQRWAGWGRETGHRYVACERCGATGKVK